MQVKIENLYFKYKTFGSRLNCALENINLQINDGEFLALVGPSGSGKTTLMQHLTGLLTPDKGRIVIDGTNLWEKGTSLTQIRRKIGLVFQFPENQLFEETLFNDVAFGPRNLGLSDEETYLKVKEALNSVELNFVKYKDWSPLHLSEGEKRRAAIAGILAMQPEFLVLDEPTAGLDYNGEKAIIKILKSFHFKGKTILMISHNMDLVSAMVNRIVLLSAGKIYFDGNKSDLFENEQILEAAGLTIPRTQELVNTLKHRKLINTHELYTVQDIKVELAKNFK